MCSIIGSANFDTFQQLYQKNLQSTRGTYARGILSFDKTGSVYLDKTKDLDKDLIYNEHAIYYLGHIQSPTGDISKYDESTIHPFINRSLNMLCAHNGVISNVDELIEKFKPKGYNHVDSSLILPLIQKLGGIKEALKVLKGTFAIWIYDYAAKEVLLAKNSSTLFVKDDQFSSIQLEGFKTLENNVIYRYNLVSKLFEPIDTFYSNSSFFI